MNSSKVLIALRIIVLADILTSLAYSLNFPFWNFGVIVKTLIELYFIILYTRHKKLRQNLIFIGALFGCWFMGVLSMRIQTNGIINVSLANFINSDKLPNPLVDSFTIFNRYIFFFILTPFILLYKNDKHLITGCKKLFETFIWANSIAIILGFVFNLNIFSSYNPGGLAEQFRFGYKGLLFGINEVTGVYFLGIAYIYREIFYFKRKKIVLLLIVGLSCFLTGTKGCILAFFMLSVIYIARYYRIVFFAFAIPAILKGLTYINPQNVENYKAAANINFDNSSLISLLLSGRDSFVIRNFAYMSQNWNILNYLFGDGILYSETDLFDLYYFFGIGALIYLIVYLKIIFKIDKTADAKYVIVALLLMAFVGGHIILSGVLPVFFCMYLITSNDHPDMEVIDDGTEHVVDLNNTAY